MSGIPEREMGQGPGKQVVMSERGEAGDGVELGIDLPTARLDAEDVDQFLVRLDQAGPDRDAPGERRPRLSGCVGAAARSDPPAAGPERRSGDRRRSGRSLRAPRRGAPPRSRAGPRASNPTRSLASASRDDGARPSPGPSALRGKRVSASAQIRSGSGCAARDEPTGSDDTKARRGDDDEPQIDRGGASDRWFLPGILRRYGTHRATPMATGIVRCPTAMIDPGDSQAECIHSPPARTEPGASIACSSSWASSRSRCRDSCLLPATSKSIEFSPDATVA